MATVPVTLQTKAYDEILKRISAGVYTPGSRLVHRKLASELGVSMTPVREALQRLEKEGFIDNHPGWGYFVKEFSASEILKIYEAREYIEPAVARLAAKKATPADASKLDKLCQKFHLAAEEKDLWIIIAKDQALHNCIAEITGNVHLERSVSNFHILNNNSIASLLITKDMGDLQFHLYQQKILGTAKDHEQIVEAIINHDGVNAERLMRLHLVNAKNAYLSGTQNEEEQE